MNPLNTIPSHLKSHQSTMDIYQLPHFRGIHVQFIPPRHYLGARVRIIDLRRGDTQWLPYDYVIGDIVEQAKEHLIRREISVDGLVLHDVDPGYTLLTKNFETAIK